MATEAGENWGWPAPSAPSLARKAREGEGARLGCLPAGISLQSYSTHGLEADSLSQSAHGSSESADLSASCSVPVLAGHQCAESGGTPSPPIPLPFSPSKERYFYG